MGGSSCRPFRGPSGSCYPSTPRPEAGGTYKTMRIGPETPLVLGSASPRRRAILETLHVPIRVVTADIDERVGHGEGIEGFLERVVRQKLAAVRACTGEAPGVLVADTIVVVDDRILGKPDSEAHAGELLRKLVGRTHTVHTRYAMVHLESGHTVERTVVTRVTMRAAGDDEIARYLQTGEGLDKAGGYAVQGIGSFLVERIEGSYSNVVGLPACEVIQDLRQVGLLLDYP